MKKHLFFFLLAATVLASCGPSDEQRAQALVSESRTLAANGQFNQARILLDSVHTTYPRCVAERRLALALADSISCIEAQRTLAYSDSLLQTLLPQVDPLMKKFVYSKNEKYEDHGQYVHRLLNTGNNTSRCFLQAYVSDDRLTTVKSYYYGASMLNQTAFRLSANEEEYAAAGGASHGFDAGGYHSIYTLEGDNALPVLNFISSHQADRIRVNLLGTNKKGDETNYVYYLSDNEKIALQDTYQLGILMHDIKALEDAVRRSNMQIEKYQKKAAKAQ